MRTPVRMAVFACVLVLLGCSERPAETGFTLESGRYLLNVRQRILKHGQPQSEDEQTDPVEVKVEGERVTIVALVHPEFPIVGQLKAGRLVAHLDDAGGTVDFTGRLTADNRMEGSMVGRSKDGDQALEGSWSLGPRAE